MDSELLKRAAVIRDETTEAANTANRVGSLLVDALTAVDGTKVDKQEGYGLATDRQRAVADWCDKHVLQDNDSSLPFLAAADKGTGGYLINHLVDGETYRNGANIPLATDKASGIMSAADHADFTTAKEDIETLFASVDETDGKVAANTEAITANKNAIDTKVDKQEGYGLASDRQRTVADWCDEHILVDNNAEVPFLKATDKGAEGYAISHCVDGNTYRNGANIPLATDKASGIMSAADHADFTTAKEDIETLFASVDETDGKVAANTASIAENKTAITANTASIATNASNIAVNEKSVAQLSNALVLPFGGTDALISSVEGTAYVAQWGAYGSLPVYASRLNLFVISAGMKHYAAWTHFTNIPDSDKYGSLHVLFYDGTKLYRHTDKALVEITADTSALEARVAALEATLAALTAETIVTI